MRGVLAVGVAGSGQGRDAGRRVVWARERIGVTRALDRPTVAWSGTWICGKVGAQGSPQAQEAGSTLVSVGWRRSQVCTARPLAWQIMAAWSQWWPMRS